MAASFAAPATAAARSPDRSATERPSDFSSSIAPRASGRTGSSSAKDADEPAVDRHAHGAAPGAPINPLQFETPSRREGYDFRAERRSDPTRPLAPPPATARVSCTCRKGDAPASGDTTRWPAQMDDRRPLRRPPRAQDVLFRRLSTRDPPTAAHRGPPARDRSRLVEGGPPAAVQRLEHSAAAKQSAPSGRPGDRDRRGHGSRDSERTRTRDDEHGESCEAAPGPIPPGHAPRYRGRDGDQRHARDEVAPRNGRPRSRTAPGGFAPPGSSDPRGSRDSPTPPPPPARARRRPRPILQRPCRPSPPVAAPTPP